MKNIWRVFRRDARRILVVPQAWIIVVGMIVVPALYAWVNILAFWDPYTVTSDISVAVVNLDEGGQSPLTGKIAVGDQVIDELKANDQLGWTFVDEAEAKDRVKSGKSYAAIIIPESFSRDLLSITSNKFTKPQVEYLVNEKANAVAPKLTDVGASTLVEEITSSFESTVAKAAADALIGLGKDAKSDLLDSQHGALASLDSAVASVDEGKENLVALQGELDKSREKIGNTKKTLADIDKALLDSQNAIKRSQTLVSQAQVDLQNFVGPFSQSFVDGTAVLATLSAQSQAGLDQLSLSLQSAQTLVGNGADGVSAVITANGAALAKLQALVDSGNLDPATAAQVTSVINKLQTHNAQDQKLFDELDKANLTGSTNAAIKAITGARQSINSSLQTTQASATAMRNLLFTAMPSLSQQLGALSGGASGFVAAIDAQRSQVAQASLLLDSLDEQLVATSQAIGGLAGNLGELQGLLSNVRTDVVALGSASLWQGIDAVSGLNAQEIADFMASPVQVSEKVMYPVSSYGSAMSALFTNLSLWIGAFVLMVIMKLEVDSEGLRRLSTRQAYMGRWLLLAGISAAQGFLVTVGNLIIGVEVANPVAFVATGVLLSLSYLSIIYALSVAFTHIGKGLCVVLVIIQIPGASGLYPIEMMPSFFQNLYPFFPFTYGINAMRETISGFYGNEYWHSIGVLALFVAAAFLLGLVLRSHLVPWTRLFNKGITDTRLLIAESVEAEEGFRLTQVLRSLANRTEYRRRLERRAEIFTKHYPRLQRGGLIAGGVVPIILVLLPAQGPSAKAMVLGLWVAWFLVLSIYFIVIEYVRDSIKDGLEVSTLPDADLHLAISGRRKLKPTRLHPLIETIEEGMDITGRYAPIGNQEAVAKESEVGDAK